MILAAACRLLRKSLSPSVNVNTDVFFSRDVFYFCCPCYLFLVGMALYEQSLIEMLAADQQIGASLATPLDPIEDILAGTSTVLESPGISYFLQIFSCILCIIFRSKGWKNLKRLVPSRKMFDVQQIPTRLRKTILVASTSTWPFFGLPKQSRNTP